MFNFLLSVNRLLDGTTGTTGNTIYDQTTDAKEITSIAEFAATLNLILRRILGPILLVIGVVAVVYAIYLGVMYAKAEDANKRKEVQGRLIGAIVGAVIIIAAATVCLAINWSDVYFSFQGKHTFGGTGTYCDYCGHVRTDPAFHTTA